MQSGFVRIICQVAIFMICAQAIVHFRPKASYEKYLKMLVSAMVLILLFQAVEGLFSPEGKSRLAERAQWFADSLDESMQEAGKSLFSEEALQVTGQDPRQKADGETEEEEGMGQGTNPVSEITVQIAPVELESVQGRP